MSSAIIRTTRSRWTGGTTFCFITEGIHAARERALQAADGQDVRVAGGSSTIRQYLEAPLIDELNLAVVPVLLGGGESLFEGIDAAALGYRCVEFASSPAAPHFVLARQT
ncbi:MAG: dihydrofolate reductase family protein [Acidimicrobiia bacterium]